MYCVTCESKLDLNTQDYCANCGELPERVMCGRCDGDFPVSLFDIHVCSTVGQPKPNSSAGVAPVEPIKEISEEENELLTTYYELQDSKKEIDLARKDALAELLAKFSQSKVLTFNGRAVGKIVAIEYPALDTALLKQRYPEIYQECSVKVMKINYIKRQS